MASDQFELAMRLVQAGRPQEAVARMKQAASSGFMLAEAQLGIWQLLGAVAERNTREGLQRVQRAAQGGEDIACLLLAGLSAIGTLAPQSWKATERWLIEAARRGNVRALTLLSLLLPESFPSRGAFAAHAAANGYSPAVGLFDNESAGGSLNAARTSPLPSWSDVESALNLESLATAVAGSVLRDSPRLLTAKQFIPASWCHYIRALADPALTPADVHNAEQGRSVQPVRTSAHMSFGAVDTDPLLAIVSHRIARWTNTPVECGERTAVLRYRPGQQYRQHVDFFDPNTPSIWAEAERAGQRTITVLIWLNTDYTGGETDFPLIDIRHRGNLGDALAFWNVTPDGNPDLQTSHAGMPVQSGEKWIISKWIRDRAQEN